MKFSILIVVAVLAGSSVSQAEGIVPLFDRPVLDMPSGYVVLDHSASDGQVLAQVDRSASLRVAGYVKNGNRRYYLSEWSWDHLAKTGREPTWVLPLDDVWSSISPAMLLEDSGNPVITLDEPREIFFPSGYVCAYAHNKSMDLSHRSEKPTLIEIYGWVDVETASRRGRVRVYQGGESGASWLMPRASAQPTREGIIMFPEVEKREFPEGRLVLCGAGSNAVIIKMVPKPSTLSVVGRVDRAGREFLVSEEAYLSWEKNECLETTIPFDGKFQEPCSGEEFLLDHAGEKRWMVSRLVSFDRNHPSTSYAPFSHHLIHDVSWGGIMFESKEGSGSAHAVLRRLELLEAVAGRKPAEDTLHAAMKFLDCPKDPWSIYHLSTEPKIRSIVVYELHSNVLTYTPLLHSIYQQAADGYGDTFPHGTLDIDKARWWQDWTSGTRIEISFRSTERLSELSSKDRDTFSKIAREATESCSDIEIATDGLFSSEVNEEQIKEMRGIALTDQLRSASQLTASTLAAAEKGDADTYKNGIKELAKQVDKEFEQALKTESKAAYELIFHEALLLCLSKGNGKAQDALTLPLHEAIAEVHTGIDARRSALAELRGLSSGNYRTKQLARFTKAMDGELAIDLEKGGSRSRKLKESEARVEIFRVAGVAGESRDTIDAQYGCLVYREVHPPVFHILMPSKDLDIYIEMMVGNFTKRGLGEVADLWKIQDDWFDETYRSVHRKLFAPLKDNLSGYSQIKIKAPGSLAMLPLDEIFLRYTKNERIRKIALASH